jgi:YVTN family beta-propeller protein
MSFILTLTFIVAFLGGAGSVALGNEHLVYMTNYDLNNVYVIDTTKDEVINTIDIQMEIKDGVKYGNGPSGIGVAANGKMYVTNFSSNTVSVIENQKEIKKIKVWSGPGSIATFGNKVYVVHNRNGNLIVIDATSDTIVKNLTREVIGIAWQNPGPMAINEAAGKGYVVTTEADSMASMIAVIDLKEDKIIKNIVTNAQNAVVVKDKVYAYDRGRFKVIDTKNDDIEAIYKIEAGTKISYSVGLAVSPNDEIYMLDFEYNNVIVFDTKTNKAKKVIPINGDASSIKISKNGKAYIKLVEREGIKIKEGIEIKRTKSISIVVIDTATYKVIKTIKVGS